VIIVTAMAPLPLSTYQAFANQRDKPALWRDYGIFQRKIQGLLTEVFGYLSYGEESLKRGNRDLSGLFQEMKGITGELRHYMELEKIALEAMKKKAVSSRFRSLLDTKLRALEESIKRFSSRSGGGKTTRGSRRSPETPTLDDIAEDLKKLQLAMVESGELSNEKMKEMDAEEAYQSKLQELSQYPTLQEDLDDVELSLLAGEMDLVQAMAILVELEKSLR